MAINNAELLPAQWGGVGERSIVSRLNQTLEAATALYASVAFWTIAPGYLSHRLEQLLGQKNSFCCVDVHGGTRGGTRLNRVLAMHEAGAANLYLFLRKLDNSSELGLNRHLLHTKLLLFDLPGGRAELWVGSHNFTAFALGGGNREASVVLTISRRTKLYRQAKAYLQALRQECLLFQREQFDQYKQLQGTDDDEPDLECFVLPLFWNSQQLPGGRQALADQAALLLTRNDSTGTRLVRHFGGNKPLLVWAYDVATNQPSYWTAEVFNAARISLSNKASAAMSYDHLLVVTVQHRQLPELRIREQELGHDFLHQFEHSFSLRFTTDVTSRYQLLPPADPLAQAHWVPDQAATEALGRLVQQERATLAGLAPTTATRPATPLSADPRLAKWEARLLPADAATRRSLPADRGTARLPDVLRPVLEPVQAAEAYDPLAALVQQLSLSAARQQLQRLAQRLAQPLQADLFSPQTPDQLTFLAREAAGITLDKVLLRYRLLRK